MKMFTRGAALTLAAVLLSGVAAFAAEGLMPVRATLEEKGFAVDWNQEEKTVIIRDGGFVIEEAVGEKISLDYDVTYADESFFEEVDAMKKAYEEYSTKATVTEVGEGYFLADTEKLGEVMFRVDDNTHFHHEMNRMLYKFNDVTVGATLKVYFAETMTASIPPQTYAKEVVFLNTEGKLAVSENSQVFKVSEVGEGYILASNEKMGEVMFKVDENTSFRHEMNRRLYTLSDVTAGINLQITFADAMTASIPPQVYASDVVFVTTEETLAENVTTSGKIVAIGEDFFTVEKEDGSKIRFNVSEETFYHHVMNRMLYKFESLEEGMNVDVIHADMLTFSLPPQGAAIEVVIK